MKRYFLMILVAFCATFSAKAINYEDARREAWFLTDKMAYELNLTPEQCDRAYEINLEYFMGIHSSSDCLGTYWHFRNMDLRYVLFSWQYNLFASIDYFYRPIRWVRSVWYYPIFNYYRRGYYYFDRPAICVSYRGGRWRRRGHNDLSPYRHLHYRPSVGLRDRYHNGKGGRPEYRPEYGRPSRPSKDFDRYDRDDKRKPNNLRSDRFDRDVHNNHLNPSIRPDRSDRPNRNDFHKASDVVRDNHKDYRPSRDYGSKHQRTPGRDKRSHSSERSHERGSRDFGR